MRSQLSRLVISSIFLITLASCSIGANTTTDSNPDSTQQTTANFPAGGIESKSEAIKLIDHGVTNVGQLHDQLRHKLYGSHAVGDSIEGTVGWDSSTQDLAQQSCWDYNITLSNNSSNAGSYMTATSSILQLGLGMSDSISQKLGGVEGMSGSQSMSLLFNNQFSSVNVGTTAYSKGIASVQISGLNTNGENILQNDPANFSHLCGDQILTQIPVMIQVSYLLNYSFESVSVNYEDNLSLSVTEAFTTTTEKLNEQEQTSLSQVSVDQSTYTQGQVDMGVVNSAAINLGYCAKTGDSAVANCMAGLNTLSNAAQSGWNTAESQIRSSGGKDVVWQAVLATDYSGKFVYQDTNQELQILGKSVIPNNPSFAEYESTIIHNVNVLQDLSIAQQALDNIAVGIYNLPADFIANFTLAPNATYLEQEYNTALTPVINNFSVPLNQCLASTTVDDINTNCAKLDSNSSVIGAFYNYFPGDVNMPSLAPAIAQTVQALIYNDSVVRNVLYNNSLVPLTSDINSYTVYLPAKQLDPTKSRSPYVLVTIPVYPSEQTSTVNGVSGVPVYVSGYQVGSPDTSETTFWNAWDNFSQMLSGEVGYYDGQLETLYPSPYRTNIQDSFVSQGVGSQVCTPFASNSHDCTYTVIPITI